MVDKIKFVGWAIISGLILWSTISLFNQASSQVLHEDEYQHTHLAWNSFQGKVIYRDFEDSHGPLSTLLYSFFLKVYPRAVESVATFFYLRSINTLAVVLTGLLLALCVFKFTNKKAAGALALLIFLSSPAIRTMAFRIRPDCYVALFSVLSFFCWQKCWHFLMGLCLGTAFALHAKFLPINLCILGAACYLSFKKKRPVGMLLLGESAVLAGIALWLWHHRALSLAWKGFLFTGFNTAFQRLVLRTESTQLLQEASRTEMFIGALCFLSLIFLVFWVSKRRALPWSSEWVMGATYTAASVAFLFAPVWGHALVFVIPTGLIFLVSSVFLTPSLEKGFSVLAVALCAVMGFTNLEKANRGKELQAGQLESLEFALNNTKRTDPVFYVWTSRCPAYVFNEDSSRDWLKPFRRTSTTQPIRMLPPVNYLSFHPMFLGILDEDEKKYVEENFTAHGCFWVRNAIGSH
ncbi:hypothetical protein EBT16_03700 [bacterium]|nr:hypothetical protein [bacterium]